MEEENYSRLSSKQHKRLCPPAVGWAGHRSIVSCWEKVTFEPGVCTAVSGEQPRFREICSKQIQINEKSLYSLPWSLPWMAIQDCKKKSFIFFRLKNFNMLLPHEAKAKDGSDGDIQRAGQAGQTAVFIHLLYQTCHCSHVPVTLIPLLSIKERAVTEEPPWKCAHPFCGHAQAKTHMQSVLGTFGVKHCSTCSAAACSSSCCLFHQPWVCLCAQCVLQGAEDGRLPQFFPVFEAILWKGCLSGVIISSILPTSHWAGAWCSCVWRSKRGVWKEDKICKGKEAAWC